VNSHHRKDARTTRYCSGWPGARATPPFTLTAVLDQMRPSGSETYEDRLMGYNPVAAVPVVCLLTWDNSPYPSDQQFEASGKCAIRGIFVG
jgi:hypothetical protein